MRQAGHLTSELDSQLVSDYLFSQGIPNEVDATNDGRWAIWIHDDRQLDAGKQILERFVKDPGHSDFQASKGAARRWKAAKEKEDARFRDQLVDVRTSWAGLGQSGLGWLTGLVVAFSVMVSTLDLLNVSTAFQELLMMTTIMERSGRGYFATDLPEIRHGQIWRLVTPIFLHGGWLHLLFNMIWLKQLGSALELKEGTVRVGLHILVYAVASNFGQYLISGPYFLGMSGVVYGLFGYIWIRGKYDPKRPYMLDQRDIVFGLVWFVVCFTGIAGSVANTAHAIGLAVGILWATLSVRRIPFTEIRF